MLNLYWLEPIGYYFGHSNGVQSFYAGFGNIDYTLERHLNVRNSIRLVRVNKGLALGNGLVFMGLLAIGIGFLIAPPLAAVAATIETTKRLGTLKK